MTGKRSKPRSRTNELPDVDFRLSAKRPDWLVDRDRRAAAHLRDTGHEDLIEVLGLDYIQGLETTEEEGS